MIPKTPEGRPRRAPHRTPKQRKRARRKLIAGLLAGALFAVVTVILCLIPYRRLLPAIKIPKIGEGEVRVHFVDMGQGDCTIVEFSAGDLFVVDAGDGSYSHNNLLARYIKGLKPKRISMLLTHANADHYGGFSALLETFGAEDLYLPVLPSEDEGYRQFLSAAEKSGCRMSVMSRFGAVRRESAYLVCLSPESGSETDPNSSSTVLFLNAGGVRVLLCGDISAARERKLLTEYTASEDFFDVEGLSVRLDNLDVLKVSHHGSGDASAEEWLKLLRPKASVISCGEGNLFGHPAGETLARLRAASPEGKIYRTDELGSVMMTIKDGTFTVTTGLEKT